MATEVLRTPGIFGKKWALIERATSPQGPGSVYSQWDPDVPLESLKALCHLGLAGGLWGLTFLRVGSEHGLRAPAVPSTCHWGAHGLSAQAGGWEQLATGRT